MNAVVDNEAMKIEVSSSIQVQIAVEKAKELAKKIGFSESDQTKIAIATSELANNILLHTEGNGRIIINSVKDPDRIGVIVIAEDEGPGIANIQQALEGVNGSKKGLGIGLSGAQRLMDKFNIESKVGKGTTVTVKKWKNQPLASERG
jgi:serine/threonine-protein kinase RsbT